jgi:hypothetical protein
MIERRTFFGQGLAFIAGLNIFASKATVAEAASVTKTEESPVSIGSASFVEMVQQHLPKDFLSEWATQLEVAPHDATTFANLYLEMMRDPHDDERRQACTIFATLMKTRSWGEILDMVNESIDTNTKAIFQKPDAEGFYEQFRAMVIEQIRDYWERFMASRMKKDDEDLGNASARS